MNPIRNGCFSSSEIVSLLKMGSRDMNDQELADHKKEFPKSRKKTIESWPSDTALNYIEECNFERRLNRSIERDVDAFNTSWGKLAEKYLFEELLDTSYVHCSEDTIVHPFMDWFVGTPDGKRIIEVEEITVEAKCPATLKSFCKLVAPIYYGLEGMDAINALRNGYTDEKGILHDKHKDGEKWYQQCVSNSILQKTQVCELVVFVPYESQLQDIRDLANQFDVAESSKYIRIANSLDSDLPSLPDGGYYKNVNTLRFIPPQEDKNLMIDIIKRAGKLLIPRPTIK